MIRPSPQSMPQHRPPATARSIQPPARILIELHSGSTLGFHSGWADENTPTCSVRRQRISGSQVRCRSRCLAIAGITIVKRHHYKMTDDRHRKSAAADVGIRLWKTTPTLISFYWSSDFTLTPQRHCDRSVTRRSGVALRPPDKQRLRSAR